MTGPFLIPISPRALKTQPDTKNSTRKEFKATPKITEAKVRFNLNFYKNFVKVVLRARTYVD